MSLHVPFHRPSIGREEIDEVVRTLESGWLTTGPRTAEFERDFRAYVGVPAALAVNSCTAAMHLALAALKIGPRDEVITTPLTFCATVNVILHVGATPVLADVGPDGNIDPASVHAERRCLDRSPVASQNTTGLGLLEIPIADLADGHAGAHRLTIGRGVFAFCYCSQFFADQIARRLRRQRSILTQHQPTRPTFAVPVQGTCERRSLSIIAGFRTWTSTLWTDLMAD